MGGDGAWQRGLCVPTWPRDGVRSGDRDGIRVCGHKPTSVGSALTLQKVMHTRKRHSELYHELNQKFHTLDRYRAPAAGTSKVRSWGGGGVASCPASPFA